MEYARHVRRSTMVDTIEQAFAFCLKAIDEEPIKIPQVAIEPMMTYDTDVEGAEPEGRIRYEVSIAGHS